MEMLSDKYGWTPEQVRGMSQEDVEAYMDILSIKSKHERDEYRKQNRKLKK